ncbi:MAG TPA: hypothetical protein VFP80_15590 [Thermoanaerobaculia bacterium]|nr:hypothetical protein [Thermoanaerobaculia bacterium]
MKVITGRVTGGKIEVETDLQEGTPVAIVAVGDTGFHLTPEEEEELVLALQEIRNGDSVDGHELLRELRGLYG